MMFLGATPPWIPYLAAQAAKVGKVIPRTHAEKIAQPAGRVPGQAGPRPGMMTRDAFLKGGGVYGGGVAGGIPSLAPQRGPAIAPGFDLL
jgi:hypothetical protein